jgi:Flp pilus assembly protein TadB
MRISILLFLLLSLAAVLLLGVNAKDFSSLGKKRRSLKSKLLLDSASKNVFKNKFLEMKYMLKIMGKEGYYVDACFLAIALSLTGAFLAVLVNNFFLIPVFAFSFLLIPYFVLTFLHNKYKKVLAEELEGGLSIITTTYLRTENISEAVSENIEFLNPPIKETFEKFLVETRYIDTNVKNVLERMRFVFPNKHFTEWVRTLILCEDNKSKKVLLRESVRKLSEEKQINLSEETAFFEPLREFITMAFLVVFNIPLVYMLNKEWFQILIGTIPGKIVIAISFAFVLIGFLAFSNIVSQRNKRAI